MEHRLSVLGAVFLRHWCGSAYADLGLFRPRGPINLHGFGRGLSRLIMNYAGQAALVLEVRDRRTHLFALPGLLLLPLIVMATVATIIAAVDHHRGIP